VVMGNQGDALRFWCGRLGHAARVPGQCCRTATRALSDRVHSVLTRYAARTGQMRYP
jgi:hypothetical protein